MAYRSAINARDWKLSFLQLKHVFLYIFLKLSKILRVFMTLKPELNVFGPPLHNIEKRVEEKNRTRSHMFLIQRDSLGSSFLSVVTEEGRLDHEKRVYCCLGLQQLANVTILKRKRSTSSRLIPLLLINGLRRR